jgi:hypothetical protein
LWSALLLTSLVPSVAAQQPNCDPSAGAVDLDHCPTIRREIERENAPEVRQRAADALRTQRLKEVRRKLAFGVAETGLSEANQDAVLDEMALTRSADGKTLLRGGRPVSVEAQALDLNGDREKEWLFKIAGRAGLDQQIGDEHQFVLFVPGPDRYRLVIQTVASTVEILPFRSSGFRELMFLGAENRCSVWRSSPPSIRPEGWIFERVDCKIGVAGYVDSRNDCVGSGGQWGPQGLGRFGGCVRPTRDGGKACNDRSECEVACLYVGAKEARSTPGAIGQCASTDSRFGCRVFVSGGKVTGGLCVD